MKKIIRKSVFILLCTSFFVSSIYGQLDCQTTKVNAKLHKSSKSLKEYKKLEKFTQNFVQSKSSKASGYVIPVIFHVFGSDFSGTTVTRAKIERVLEELNKDFNGQNDDYGSVDARFSGIKSTLNIQFKLVKKDPNGNATTGVKFYSADGAGFGGVNKDNEIKNYAWDNYKYFNVYIVSDLYNDGVYTRSGVAWYPDSGMSNNNLARAVYNGRYLFGNTDKEFASVLTHEFGHYLNLIHTHEDGCNGTDNVDDTPQDEQGKYVNSKWVATGSNDCDNTNECGVYINYENYMGYNGGKGCYKMFTEGQVTRMQAALEHSARRPLWQDSNLIATGLQDEEQDIAIPTIPSGLSESSITSTSFRANWSSVPGATSYEVKVWNGSWESKGTTSNSYMDVSGFSTNSSQYWKVNASNSKGSSSFSNYRNIQLSGGDETGGSLAIPGDVRSSGTYSSGFYAGWNTTSDVSSYEVQLKTNGSWTAEGTSNTYYLWIGKKGSRTSYTFRVRGVSGSDTSNWSDEVTISLPASGPSKDNFSGLTAFPNPVNSGAELTINNELPNGSIEIYNVQGVRVDNMNFATNTIKYNTGKLSAGIYFIKVSNGVHSEIQRLIVK